MSALIPHFLRPGWLWALIPFVLLTLWLWRQRFQAGSNWQQVIDPHLLPYLTNAAVKSGKSRGYLLVCVVCMLATLAMAGPSWTERHVPVYTQKNASVIVLDQSANILATDLAPSRLMRARFKIRDLLAHPEGQMGLIVYAGEPYVVSPITEDHKTIAAFLNDLSPVIMPAGGNNISAALNKAADLLKQAGMDHGDIILISSAHQVSGRAQQTAEKLHQAGFDLTVLGVGTRQGAPLKLPDGEFVKNEHGNIITRGLDKAGLQKLAQAGGGQYIAFSGNSNDIDTILNRIKQRDLLTQNQAEQTQQIFQWVDQGYLLIWCLLPFVLLAFRRGWMEKC